MLALDNRQLYDEKHPDSLRTGIHMAFHTEELNAAAPLLRSPSFATHAPYFLYTRAISRACPLSSFILLFHQRPRLSYIQDLLLY